MNDYKALIEKLRMAGRWIKHDDGSEETYLLSVADCAEIADAIEQLVRERDAAVESIKQCWLCASCKKRIRGNEWARCKHFEAESVVVKGDKSYTCKNWEWRGVQK